MVRVHYVEKARKDNPVVKAGESYYWWKFRYGSKQFSKRHPRQSQLTQSEYLGQLYSLEEGVDDRFVDFLAGAIECCDMVASLEEASAEVSALGDECEAKADNLPESFQDGDSASLLRDRAEACGNLVTSIDEAVDAIVSWDEDDGSDVDTAQAIISNIEWSDAAI